MGQFRWCYLSLSICVDCFLHHMLWQDYRVVLLVPLNASGGLKVLATTSICIYCHVYVSVHPSVCNRRSAETIWPQDTRRCISGYWVLKARTRQSLWAPVMTLATGTNTSFLDRLYKIRHIWTLTCSSHSYLNSSIHPKILSESSSRRKKVVFLASCLHTSHKRDGEQTNKFLGQLIN